MITSTHGIVASQMTAFDPDALAYLNAANITNTAQRTALNTLVVSLKSSGVWAKCIAIYPMMGITSASQSWNLRNLTQFNITWVNPASGIYNTAGFLGQGLAYGQTSINPSTNLSQNDNHLMIYSGTDNQSDTALELGAASGSGATGTQIYAPRLRTATTSVLMYANNIATNDFDSISNGNARGFYINQRSSSTSSAAIKNGTIILTSTKVSRTPANFQLFLGGINGSGTFLNGTQRYISFASAGQSFTSQQITDYYNAVQAFQTVLNRNYTLPQVSDPNAQQFINAANIISQTHADAINTLVIDMKAQGLWNKCIAIYPIVGGTQSAHSYNLKNPSQYNLNFVNTWNHSGFGATPNGTTAYADTGINGSTVLTQNDSHLSFYSRTDSAAAARSSMGAHNNSTAPNEIMVLSLKNTSGNAGAFNTSQATGQPALVANANSQGFYINNKTSSAIGGLSIVKNGSVAASNTVAITTNTYANRNIFIGACSITNLGIGVAFQYDDKQCAFASIGSGLTVSECSTYTTIVNNFQAALSRNVF